jgi:hypothetical protein
MGHNFLSNLSCVKALTLAHFLSGQALDAVPKPTLMVEPPSVNHALYLTFETFTGLPARQIYEALGR